MKRHAFQILLSLVFCMLVGCSTVLSSSIATPTGSPTSGTTSPISITTDRTTYAPTDVIQAMVSNHGAGTISVTAGHASCTVVSLEIMTNGRWQPSDAAACPSQPVVALVQIAAGATYHQFIRAFQLPARPGTFPSGEYRLSLVYWNTVQGSIPSVESGNEITSAPFTIGTGAVSTTPTPQGHTTPLPPVGPIATPTASPQRTTTPLPPVGPIATPIG
jgi:uncharacterized protein YceK